MDYSKLAGQILTPELLEQYFSDLEDQVAAAEDGAPGSPPTPPSPFGQLRTEGRWRSDILSESVCGASLRPDLRELEQKATPVPYRLASLKTLPGGASEQRLGESSLVASWENPPSWTSRTGHRYPGAAFELELDLEAPTPVNALDTGIDPGFGLRLAELWYEGGDMGESKDSTLLRSVPVKAEERLQLFAPVLARRFIMVLSSPVGVSIPGGFSYAWQGEAPRPFTLEGPLAANVPLVDLTGSGPVAGCQVEVREDRPGAALLAVGRSSKYLGFTSSGGVGTLEFWIDPQRCWSAQDDPTRGIALPLPAGSYHLRLLPGSGGWASQDGPGQVWSKLVWIYWNDGEIHRKAATHRDTASLASGADPALDQEDFSFTLKQDATVWLWVSGNERPRHSIPIQARLTSEDPALCRGLLRPGDWIDVPLTTGGAQMLPVVNTASSYTTQRNVDSVLVTLAGLLEPCRCWVYARQGAQWIYLDELLVSGEQTFEVPVNLDRVSQIRLFFPPLSPGLPLAGGREDGAYLCLRLDAPAMLEVGPDVEAGLLLTARLPEQRPSWTLTFADPSRLINQGSGRYRSKDGWTIRPESAGAPAFDMASAALVAKDAMLIAREANPCAELYGAYEVQAKFSAAGSQLSFSLPLGGGASAVRVIVRAETSGSKLALRHLVSSQADGAFVATNRCQVLEPWTTAAGEWTRIMVSFHQGKICIWRHVQGAWKGLAMIDLVQPTGSGSWTIQGAPVALAGTDLFIPQDPVLLRAASASLRYLTLWQVTAAEAVPFSGSSLDLLDLSLEGKDERVLLASNMTGLATAPYAASGPDCLTRLLRLTAQADQRRLALPAAGSEKAHLPPYSASWREALLSVSAFADPLWQLGLAALAGSPSYSEGGELTCAAGTLRLGAEELAPRDSWCVEADLRFNTAAATHSQVTLRLAESASRFLQITIRRTGTSQASDGAWSPTAGGAAGLTLSAGQVSYLIETHLNTGAVGCPYIYVDPVSMPTAIQTFRLIREGRYLVLSRLLNGVWTPRLRWDLTATGTSNVPLDVDAAAPAKELACWKPTAASYRAHPEGWSLLRPEILLDSSHQAWLRSLNLRESGGRALRVWSGDAALLGEWSEPCAVYNSAGAVSSLSYGFMQKASPDAWAALPTTADSLAWLELESREGDTPDLDITLLQKQEGVIPNAAATLSAADAYDGAPGLLQLFDLSGRRQASIGVGSDQHWRMDLPWTVHLPAGTTLFALGKSWRLWSAPPRHIHLSRLLVALDGAPLLRPGQVRYELTWGDKTQELIPAPQQAARGLTLSGEFFEDDGFGIEPDTSAKPADGAATDALMGLGIVLSDEDGVLESGSDYRWTSGRVILPGWTEQRPHVFFPAVSGSSRFSFLDQWSWRQLTLQMENSNSIELPIRVYPPWRWIFLQGQPRVSPEAIVRLKLDGQSVPDVTDYHQMEPIMPEGGQLVCWTDGKTIRFSRPVTGKVELSWPALPDGVKLTARIELPEGLVRSWPRLKATVRAGYYRPSRRK